MSDRISKQKFVGVSYPRGWKVSDLVLNIHLSVCLK